MRQDSSLVRAWLAMLTLSILAPLAHAGDPGLERAVLAYLGELEDLPRRDVTIGAATAGEESWTFDVALYLWAAGVKGDLGVRGVTVPVDVGFDEIFDKLEGALMLHGTAGKGRWGGFFDFAWIGLGADTTGPLGQPASVDSDLFFVELAVTYRAIEHPLGDQAQLFVDGYAGLRVYAAETDLTLVTGPRNQDGAWVDPILGFDAEVQTGQWLLGVRADIGGFGAGSDLSWAILVGARYRISELFSLALGYRWLDIDYSTGSGADAFTFDVQMAGPVLAVAFSF
jgi:opacity protein-like surface antigen